MWSSLDPSLSHPLPSSSSSAGFYNPRSDAVGEMEGTCGTPLDTHCVSPSPPLCQPPAAASCRGCTWKGSLHPPCSRLLYSPPSWPPRGRPSFHRMDGGRDCPFLSYCTVLNCTILTIVNLTILYWMGRTGLPQAQGWLTNEDDRALNWTVLYCTILYCTVLYRTVAHCTVQFCFVLKLLRLPTPVDVS